MADDEQKFDPFKPSQPRIPGVSDAAPPAAPAAEPKAARLGRLPPQWIALGAGGAVVLGIALGWLLLRPSAPAQGPAEPGEPAATAASTPSEPAATVPASSTTSAPEVPPIYPDEVAAIAEMARPWSVKRFTFLKKITAGPVPALLVRLPGGTAKSADSYWAFSLKAPYGKCELEFISDVERLRNEYNYRAQHPMVVDPCTQTVFDPLKRGSVGGAWVRGDVVHGSGMRPPLMILVEIKGDRILATRME